MTPEETLRQALLEDKFPDYDDNPIIPIADPLKYNRMTAVSAWMGNLTGQDISPEDIGWQAEKDALAQDFFNMPTAKDMSDESIHDLIRSHIQTSDSTTNLALESALSGRPLPQALSEIHALTGVAKTRGIRDRYLNEASSIYGNVAAKVTPYRGLINEAAGVLGEKMRAEDQPLGEMTDAFNSVAEKLAGIPEQDRRLVIEAIAATGGTTAEERSSYLSKMGARVNRIAETMGAAAQSNLSTALEKVLDVASYGSGLAIPSDISSAAPESNQSRELTLLAQQIRTAAADKLDPVRGNSWLQNQGLAAAEMATQSSIAIANPLVAFGANLAYFRDTIGADAMTQNPGMTVEQSDKISAVAAPVNAAIETVTALIPWGKVKLPVLQKWLMSETASVGGAARNFGIRAITGTGAEIGEEWLQAYAPLKAQELMSGLKQDMPSVDWEKNMPKFADIAAEVWAPALLFSLVGGGVASINDIKNGRSLASDLDMMVAKGIAPETAAKIKEASDAGDYNNVDSLFRAEFVSESKASEPDIQAATERLKARFKTQENVEALTETTSPEYTASVTRTPSGWQVTTGDGTIIPAETAEGAYRIYNGLRQSGSLKEAQVFAETLDAAYASGMARGAAVNLTGETVTSDSRSGLVTAVRIDENKAPIPGSERYFGPGALDTIHKEAEVAGFKSGTQNVSFHINGSNEAFPSRVADTAKGIWRMINIFKAKKDGLPMITTFLHEDIESKFRLGLANGAWSKEDARIAFRALAPAFANIAEPVGKSADEVASMSKASRQKYEEDLDAKKLEYEWVKNVRKIVDGNMDDTLVRETFSEMYVRDRFAKDRRGKDTGFKPMQISRALEAAVVGANTNEEASALKRILAMFRAFSAHMKAVFGTVKAMVKARDNGTIGEDWDAFVDKVLGIDEVKRDEGKALNEAQAILEDSNMPFSISPAFSVSQDMKPLRESDLSTGWLSYPTPKGDLTKAKVIKYLKNAVNKPASRKRLAKFVMSYDDAQDLMDHTYYHGTSNFISSTVKPSITLSDKKAEEMGGGGYGEKYWAISLSKSKRKAESFSGQSRSVSIHPVLLKKSAKVISMPDVTDAADLDNHILNLWRNQVDAVWIGGGEEELAVINPKAIVFSQDSDSYAVFGGFKSENFTLQKAETVRNQAQSIIDNYSDESPQKLSFSISVPTSDIDTIPEDLARAEADMKAGGKDWAAKVDLSQPVGVYRGEDGRLKLFDGHHRWLAARERGEPLQVRESVFGRAVPIGEAPVVADLPDGAQLVGPATFSITAYHGTPHKVDKFSTAKIGTGEGAQAFGWGLYFADAKEVAEGYRSALTNRKKDVFLDGKLVDKKSLTNEEFKAVNMIELFGSAEAAIEAAANPDDAQFIRENAGRIQIKDQGNLYTVELLPDEADFLDWDKPLSEQSEKVRAKLSLLLDRDLEAESGWRKLTGEQGYKAVGERNGGPPKDVSTALAAAGIPGIKYLDGNSRDGGSGTSNYVIFDESLVKILEENGRKVEGQSFSISPITPAGDAEYLAAVEAGDMTKAQAMVDAAAKKARLKKVWRKGSVTKKGEGGFHFGTKEQADSIEDDSQKSNAYFIKASNPVRLTDYSDWSDSGLETQGYDLDENAPIVYLNRHEGLGDNGAVDLDGNPLLPQDQDSLSDEEFLDANPSAKDSFIIRSSSQIKSADPVTRDDSGQVIPLSQRFNPETPNINFSISPVTPAQDRGGLSESEFNQLSEKDQISALRSYDVNRARSIIHSELNLPENNQYTHLTFEDEPSKSSKSDSLYYLVKAWLTESETDRLFKKDEDGFLEYDYQLEEAGYQIDDDGVYKGLEIRISDHPSTASARTDADIELIVDDGRSSHPSWYQGHPDAYRSFTLAASNIPKRVSNKLRLNIPESAFNPNSSFSISPIRNLNELSDQVERQFAENPVKALEVKTRMIRQFSKYADKWSQERWTPQGNKIRPISDKRTVKSLDKEQAMRQAQREVELVNEGIDKLTPETLMAWSQGVDALDNHPLIQEMLGKHGKLMSLRTAQKEGKDIKDQYDDAPWIPPQWYAKSGGIMPDVMADNLKFGYAKDMWAEIESVIKTYRDTKEDYAKAEAAVKAVEKAAFEQARKEAQAWRDEADAMQKEDWSPKESLVRDLITLEAIRAMFPQEIRDKIGGFVTLARKASESARLKVLQKQLERGQVLLEKHLKEQYGEATNKLLKRYKSQKDASGRITGKILSTATEQVDWAAAVMDMTLEQQSEKSDVLEKIIEEPKDGDDVQDALNRLGILRLFEVWDMKDSAAREAAFNWLAETIELGKQGKKILDEERKAFLTDMRQSAQSSILEGDKLNPAVADNITNLNKGVLKSALLRMRGILSSSLWTTMQRLELIFGEDSKIMNHFAEKIINAANLSTDIKRLVEAQKKEALSIIFNSDSKFAHARGIAELQKMKKSGISIRKVVKKEVKLDLETLTKLNDGTMTAETAGLRQDEVDAALEEFANNGRKSSVTIEQVVDAGEPVERTMSETQGIQWWLWSMQDASRKQMERDGWDADSFAKLDKFLSPEAKALGRWISGSYQDAAGLIDPVYRKLFNAPLPRTKNYSPIHRRNMSTGGDIMDMEASDISSGLAAGFVKARVNTTASLVESDALAVFLAHWENVSHWVSHAELMRDMKGVLLDKDTAVAIRQKKSEGYLQRLKEDIKTIESNGTNSAKELVDISRMWRWFMQFRAYKGLAFRISPIIKQTPAMLNPLLADVPAHNYMMGMARAFMEPQTFAKEVSAMWSSDIIRRRIESGFSAESRVAMQGSSMTGSQAILVMQAGMMPMSMVDGGWTALGAAISFDYYRRGYMRDNPQMTPELADSAAIARVEKMIATSAQPSDVYARALYERSGNPFMRSMSMFVSDQRKTLAIELVAIRRLATGKSKNKALDVQRAIVAHVVMASVSQVMAGVIASLLGDDEDRDREWSAEQWTLALALGPINGLFVFGRLIDKAGRFFINSDFYQERFGTGQKLGVFPNDNLADKAFVDIYKAGKNMDDLFDPENPEDFMDELDNLSSAVGAGMSAAFGPVGGAVDVGANLVREGRKVAKRVSE